MYYFHVFLRNCELQSVLTEVLSIFNQNPATLQKNEYGDSLSFYACDIEFCIMPDHGFEDDLGIKFSEYPIAIRLIKLRNGEDCLNYNDLVLVVAKYLAEKLAKRLNCQTIITRNLQRIIDEYH